MSSFDHPRVDSPRLEALLRELGASLRNDPVTATDSSEADSTLQIPYLPPM